MVASRYVVYRKSIANSIPTDRINSDTSSVCGATRARAPHERDAIVNDIAN